jgi:hypothetical protein
MNDATAVGLLLLGTLGILAVMRIGWARRGRRTSAALPEIPAVPGERRRELYVADVTYVSTTLAGRWMERVVAHGLGNRSRARLSVSGDGVLVERDSGPRLYIPAEALRGVGRAAGIAGKVTGSARIVVMRWQWSGADLDTGVLPTTARAGNELAEALRALIEPAEEEQR